MTENQTYAIRVAFLVPLGILLGQILLLFGLSWSQGQPTAKLIILACMTLPLGILFAESVARRVVLTPEVLRLRKLLRTKTLPFAEVTSLDTMAIRKRVYLTLSAGDDFVILSNSYARFPELVRGLLQRVPERAVSEDLRKLSAAPPVKYSDIVSCWVAVGLLCYILLVQLRGGVG